VEKLKVSEEAKRFKKVFAKKILDLMTSGFGLVAALAWNEFIKELIEEYIQPILGESSGLVSKLIYAVLITFLAVLVTYNLSKLGERKD
jgi:uncharacterized membrane protein (DUF106 family)